MRFESTTREGEREREHMKAILSFSIVSLSVIPVVHKCISTSNKSGSTSVYVVAHMQVTVSGVEKYTKLDSGVYIYDVEEGSGPSPKENDQVNAKSLTSRIHTRIQLIANAHA